MIPHAVEYYLDEKLTQRLPVDINGGAIIDWEESTPGQKRERVIFMKNLRQDRIRVRQPFTKDPDLKIVDFPSVLMGHESGPVKFEFTPQSNRLDPMHADWWFEMVIG